MKRDSEIEEDFVEVEENITSRCQNFEQKIIRTGSQHHLFSERQIGRPVGSQVELNSPQAQVQRQDSWLQLQGLSSRDIGSREQLQMKEEQLTLPLSPYSPFQSQNILKNFSLSKLPSKESLLKTQVQENKPTSQNCVESEARAPRAKQTSQSSDLQNNFDPERECKRKNPSSGQLKRNKFHNLPKYQLINSYFLNRKNPLQASLYYILRLAEMLVLVIYIIILLSQINKRLLIFKEQIPLLQFYSILQQPYHLIFLSEYNQQVQLVAFADGYRRNFTHLQLQSVVLSSYSKKKYLVLQNNYREIIQDKYLRTYYDDTQQFFYIKDPMTFTAAKTVYTNRQAISNMMGFFNNIQAQQNPYPPLTSFPLVPNIYLICNEPAYTAFYSKTNDKIHKSLISQFNRTPALSAPPPLGATLPSRRYTPLSALHSPLGATLHLARAARQSTGAPASLSHSLFLAPACLHQNSTRSCTRS